MNKQKLLREGIDSVSLDIPLLIRLLEYAREDAKDDMDLHRVAEKLVVLSQDDGILSMDDYDIIVGKISEAFAMSKHDIAKRLYSHHLGIKEGRSQQKHICSCQDKDKKSSDARDIQLEDIDRYVSELDLAGYGITEEKRRLDKKCWPGKKIGTPKTKIKNGIRVNNCVPAKETQKSLNEFDDIPELTPDPSAPKSKPHPLAVGIGAARTLNNMKNVTSDTIKNAAAGELSNFARSFEDPSSKNLSTIRKIQKGSADF